MKKLLTIMAIMLVSIIVASTSSCDDDYLNEMMLSNNTEYNWHNAFIYFMDSKNNVKKRKELGTLERHNYTYVQREADYFFVEFKDDLGSTHQTEKYLTATTVEVRTVAK